MAGNIIQGGQLAGLIVVFLGNIQQSNQRAGFRRAHVRAWKGEFLDATIPPGVVPETSCTPRMIPKPRQPDISAPGPKPKLLT